MLAIHQPDEISLGRRGHIEEEHAVESFRAGELGRQFADVVGRADEEDIGLMLGEPGQESAEEARGDAGIALAAHARQSFVEFITKEDARTHGIGDA